MQAGIKSKRATPTCGHLRRNAGHVAGISGHVHRNTHLARYDRPHSLFYMDPPYWGTEGYGVKFGLENYDQMASLMGSMKGKAVVSVNDIPEMRKAFKGHHIKRVSIT
jgi:DNA adenine methylase